jgi:hypothetical protein
VEVRTVSRGRGRKRQGSSNGNGNGQPQKPQQKQGGDREWVIGQAVDEHGDLVLSREAVVDGLAELEPMGHRQGGAFVVTPLRVAAGRDQLTGSEIFDVVGWHVKRVPFVPAIRLPEQQPPAAFTEEQFDLEPQQVHDGDPEPPEAAHALSEDEEALLAQYEERPAPALEPEPERVVVEPEESAASIVNAR